MCGMRLGSAWMVAISWRLGIAKCVWRSGEDLALQDLYGDLVGCDLVATWWRLDGDLVWLRLGSDLV